MPRREETLRSRYAILLAPRFHAGDVVEVPLPLAILWFRIETGAAQIMAHDHAHAAHTHVHDANDPTCCSHHEIAIDRWIVFTLVGGILVLASTVASIFALTGKV